MAKTKKKKTSDEIKLDLLKMKVGNKFLTPAFFIAQYPEYEEKVSHVNAVFYSRVADEDINNKVGTLLNRLKSA